MSEQSDALNRAVREKGIQLESVRPISGCLDVQTPAGLPLVPLPRAGEQMISFAANIGSVVGANGLYRRGSVPVTIDPETGAIEAMHAARFQSYVENHLTTFAWRGNAPMAETMNLREAQACLSSDALTRPLRKLRRVNFARLPTMRRDGRIELLPKAWDPESSIFTIPNSVDYDPGWDLERARLFLDDLLGEFPFVDDRSRAAHILAMLTVFGSDLLPLGAKPLNFAYRANTSRAGKNLLVSSAIAGPHGSVRIQVIPEDVSEFRKILDSEALNGSPYIVLDEASGKIANRTLTSFLTATIWSGRVLGSQKHFVAPVTATVFLIGNNLDLSGDLAGRCVLVDLYVSEANPQDRNIRRVIDDRYLTRTEVRADILAALYALVLNWDRRLRPTSSLVYRGFEWFCKVFGGIVEAAGYASPFRSTVEEIDSDYADMLAIVATLCEKVVSRAEYDFGEVVDVARSIGAFEWIVGAGAGDELTPKSRSWFGRLLSRQYGGRVFRLKDRRCVRWSRRGVNRQRRYTVEVLQS